jgi:hypothetical protein
MALLPMRASMAATLFVTLGLSGCGTSAAAVDAAALWLEAGLESGFDAGAAAGPDAGAAAGRCGP